LHVTSEALDLVQGELPSGVRVVPLTRHDDDRGNFTEVFREEWAVLDSPVQWNVVRSEPGVLRGVHVHLRHDDYLMVIAGRGVFGLRDMRSDTSTPDAVALVELSAERPATLVIPHGVAHGFYFFEPSTTFYAVTQYWNMDDELGCQWDDPALGIPWPITDARVSPRDQTAPSFATLCEQLAPHQPI
jgi:dTDP-4-dehydrorhamnose 3,5-epimerase